MLAGSSLSICLLVYFLIRRAAGPLHNRWLLNAGLPFLPLPMHSDVRRWSTPSLARRQQGEEITDEPTELGEHLPLAMGLGVTGLLVDLVLAALLRIFWL